MKTPGIREELHNYLEVADEKKLKAIYVMVEDEIKETNVEYTPELKADLDRRVNNYLSGGKTVSPAEMNKRLSDLRKKRK